VTDEGTDVATDPLLKRRPFVERKDVRDAYGVAFVALALSTLMLVAAGTTPRSPIAAAAVVLLLFTLAVTMRVSGIATRARFAVLGGTGVAVIIGVAGAALAQRTGALILLIAWFSLIVTTIWGIFRRIKTYERVTMSLVLGLLCVYLLLGLGFGVLYAILGEIARPALTGADAGMSGDVYFSFITMATVGYGDLTPANSLVRAVAVAEAILGQLYLVSVVSLAVGRLGIGRSIATDASEGEQA
jgi:hypothetical protein